MDLEKIFGMFLFCFYLFLVIVTCIALAKGRKLIFATIAGFVGLIFGGINFFTYDKEGDVSTRSAVAFLVALMIFFAFVFFQTQSRGRKSASLH